MPFNIGPGELIVVLIIALIVVGPGKLPDVGAALGKSIREFRKAAADVKETTSMEVAAPTAPAPAAQATAAQAPAATTPAIPATPPAVPSAPPATTQASEPVAVAAAADAEEQTSA